MSVCVYSFVLNEVMKSTSCFHRGSVFLSVCSEILMTHTYKTKTLHNHKPTQGSTAGTPPIVNTVV